LQDLDHPSQEANDPSQDHDDLSQDRGVISQDFDHPSQDRAGPTQEVDDPSQDGLLTRQDDREPSQDRLHPREDGSLPGQEAIHPAKDRLAPSKEPKLPSIRHAPRLCRAWRSRFHPRHPQRGQLPAPAQVLDVVPHWTEVDVWRQVKGAGQVVVTLSQVTEPAPTEQTLAPLHVTEVPGLKHISSQGR
jgi:hypothetical protein